MPVVLHPEIVIAPEEVVSPAVAWFGVIVIVEKAVSPVPVRLVRYA